MPAGPPGGGKGRSGASGLGLRPVTARRVEVQAVECGSVASVVARLYAASHSPTSHWYRVVADALERLREAGRVRLTPTPEGDHFEPLSLLEAIAEAAVEP